MMKNFKWKSLLPHVIAVAIFLILSAWYTKPVFENKIVEQHDVQQWKAMAQQSYEYKAKHGYLPYWTNSMFSGMPAYQIAMEPKSPSYVSILYFHPLFSLGLPKPTNFLFLLCIGFYFLCVVMGVNSWLSIAGAIAYAFSSYNPILIAIGHDTKVLTLAYAPAVIGSLILLFKKNYWIGGALLIITTTLLFAFNHQQIVYYTFLIILCMLVGFIYKCIREKDYKHLMCVAGLGLLAGVIALCSVAFTYLPVYEFSEETMRGGASELTSGNTNAGSFSNKTKGGLDKDYAFQWSYGKAETLTLIVPNAFGGGSSTSLGDDSKVSEFLQSSQLPPQMQQQLFQAASAYWGEQPFTNGPVYIGALVCFLGLAGFIISTNKNKWWLLASAIIGIILAWGKNFEAINYFLFDHLPFYNKFRAPSMSLVMPALAMPLMAVLFLQELIDKGKEARNLYVKKSAMIAGACAVLLAAFYLFASFSNSATEEIKKSLASAMNGNTDISNGFIRAWLDDRKALYTNDLLRSLFFIAVGLGSIFAYSKQWLKKNALTGIIFVLFIADLLPVDKRYFNDDNFVEKDNFQQAYAKYNADLFLDKDTSFYRVLNLAFPAGNGTFTANINNTFNDAIASYYHNSIGGYSPAKLSDYEDLKNSQIIPNIQFWAHNPNAKDSFPVLNMLNMKYVILPDQQNPKQTMALPNPYALGNCWFVKEMRFVPSANEEMKALNNFSPATTAFINEKYKNIAGNQPVYDSTAKIQLIKNDNDYISYHSSANSPQFAVFSEVYYSKGWNVYVDNKKMNYCKVDYTLRGMPVPAGNHTIEFKFEPYLVQLGEKLSNYAGIVGAIFILAFVFLEYKKRKEAKV